MAERDEGVATMQLWKQNRAKTRLQESIGIASQSDPVAARKSYTEASAAGVPVETAQSFPTETAAISNRLRVNTEKLLSEAPRTAEWMSTPMNAAISMDDVQVLENLERAQRRQSGYWGNLGLGIGERVNSLTGNLMQLAGHSVSGYEGLLEAAGVLEQGGTDRLSDKMDFLGEAVSSGGLGYTPQYTWDDFKGNMSAGELAGYVTETGAQSLVDIAGMLASLPVYLASRTQEIAESRAENTSGQDVDAMELVKSLPTAVVVSLIDRYSAKGALGKLLGDSAGKVTAKMAATELAKSTFREAGTEFVQEAVEYAGETVGTDKKLDGWEAVDRGLAGAVAGGPMGAGMRGGSLVVQGLNNRIARNVDQNLKSMIEQDSTNSIISSIQGSKLFQDAPEKAKEFLAGLDPEDRLFISPDALEEAKSEGMAIPDYMQTQLDAGTDVAITIEQLAMDVVANEPLLEKLRPHMKRSAETLTPYELENRDTSQIEKLMVKAGIQEDMEKQADAVLKTVSDQLAATDQMSKADADLSAEVVRSYVLTKAADLRAEGVDISVEQVFKDLNFSVEAANELSTDTQPDVLAQQVEETFPEANPRLRMHYKEVTKRVPELTEAAQKVKSGEMEASEYKALVEEYKPVSPYESIPEPNTADEIVGALHSNQKEKFGAPARELTEGEEVGMRLDIPAYKDHGVWAVTIHKPGAGFKAGKVVGYDSVALLNNATLGAHEGASMSIASGKPKGTIAVVKGKHQAVSPEIAKMMAERAMKDPSWVQVGFDPERHSYFYNRETMEPVVGGDSVLQVGPLTLVKNPKSAPASDFLFQSTPTRSISTRQPTGKAATENALEENLIVGIDSFLDMDPKTVAKNLDLIEAYPGYRKPAKAKTDKQRAEAFIKHIESNLLYLHDQINPVTRERSTHWYDGARRIAETFSSRYNVSPEAVAGTLAALSPQKDWFMNVTQAERVLDIYSTHQNTAWNKKMDARIKGIVANQTATIKKGEAKGRDMSRSWSNLEKYSALLDSIKGKKLSELDLTLEKAVWIRVFDESNYSRSYRIVSPEGYFQEPALTNKGVNAMHGWGSNSEIAKAISVIEDDSFENINTQMGEMHKVRNFYNNILNPVNDPTSVTIDTHAVAAGMLQPYSAKSTPVAHNFASGAGSSSVTGNKGTYGLYAEAYRRAAAQRDILPRQMQSITWEAVRGLYTAGFKTKENVDNVNNIWAQYSAGEITLAKARKEANTYANGIQAPSWDRPDSRLSSGEADTSLAGELSGTGVPRRAAGAVDDGAGNGAAARDAKNILGQSSLAELSKLLPDVVGQVEFIDDVAYDQALDAAAETGYTGDDIAEAASWVNMYQTDGAESLTDAERMKRAEEMGFDTSVVYYHGSPSAFQEFDPNKVGKQTPDSFPQGFYFTTNKGMAKMFADGPNGVVREFYLKKGESIVVDDPAQKWNRNESFNKGNGDSLIMDDGEVVVIRDPSSIRSTAAAFDTSRAAEPNILAQEEGPVRRGEIEMKADNERIIRLGKASDLSTFLHESAHLFLEAEKQFAREYGTTDNQKALLGLLKVNDFSEIGVAEHELFARTFEDYLRTGKAPSVSLRRAFAAFARWFAKIYQKATQLGMELDQEAIDVFDRLLATQEEIEAVAANPIYDQYFKSKEQAGMSDARWKRYVKSQERRKERAEMTLFEKLVEQLAKRKTQEWRDEKAPHIEEQKTRLGKEPVYQARRILKDMKLDRDIVMAAWESQSDVPFNKSGLQFLSKKGGEDPGLMSQELGFASVEDLVQQLQSAPSLTNAAKDAAQEIMIAKYGDILNDGSIEKEAKEAMSSEAHAKALLADLKAMASKTRKRSSPELDLDYLKAKAAETVSGLTFAEMKPERFRNAEIRAAQRVAKSKSVEEAYDNKMEQLANHYLYDAATAARRDMIKYRDHIKAVQKRDYKAKYVDKDYVQAMKQLAKSYDTANRPKMAKRIERARAFAGWVQGQIDGGVDVNIKDLGIIGITFGDSTLPSFDELTLGHLRSTYEQLKHLRFVGGKLAGNMKSELEAERDLLNEQAEKTGKPEPTATEIIKAYAGDAGVTPESLSPQIRETILKNASAKRWKTAKSKGTKSKIQHAIFLVPSLRNMIRTLDGDPLNEGGAFYDSIFRRITAAENRKLELNDDFYGKMDELLGDFDVRMIADSSESGKTIVLESGEPMTMSARQRVMLAAYWGTESSREAIRQGHGMTDADVQEMMETLTDEQLNTVESIWALSDHIKTPLFEAAIEREGVAPATLEHTPFTVNGRQLKGGHMRLFYGGSNGEVEAKIRMDTDPLNAINSVVPSNHGSNIERRGSGGRKVVLDTSNIYRNIDEAAHFIAYAKTASDLQTIFNNKDLRQTIASRHGEGFGQALMQSIQGLTTNYKEAEPIPVMAGVIRQMRYAKSMMYLAYNLKNIIQQLASVVPSMAEMGPFNYIAAASSFHGAYAENRAFVHSKSAQMKGRRQHLNREMSDIMKRVESGTKWETTMNKFGVHGFTPHVILDEIISMPTWLAAYKKGMADHGDEQRSIADADVMVAETIGSGMDLHLGKVFRSNENAYTKMLTVFGSWFNSSVFQRAYRNTRGGKKWMSGPSFEALLITPLLTMAMSEVLAMNIPHWDDDDDDRPFGARLAAWAALGYSGFMGATLPIIGDLLPSQSNFKPSTLLNDALYGSTEFVGDAAGLFTGDTTPIEGLENFIKAAG